jgi:hypothetical protein
MMDKGMGIALQDKLLQLKKTIKDKHNDVDI